LDEVVLVAVQARRAHQIPAGSYNTTFTVQEKHEFSEGKLKVMLRFVGLSQPDAFKIEAEFMLAYTLPSKPSDSDATAFAQQNVPFNAWPYWRELVQSTVVRMGLPAPVVPLLKA
jgi:hypothetical protein